MTALMTASVASVCLAWWQEGLGGIVSVQSLTLPHDDLGKTWVKASLPPMNGLLPFRADRDHGHRQARNLFDVLHVTPRSRGQLLP